VHFFLICFFFFSLRWVTPGLDLPRPARAPVPPLQSVMHIDSHQSLRQPFSDVFLSFVPGHYLLCA
jgi:hypothetical protein